VNIEIKSYFLGVIGSSDYIAVNMKKGWLRDLTGNEILIGNLCPFPLSPPDDLET
jgi:hypothetical protein